MERVRDRYSMVIEWSDEDQAFIVTVPELLGCRTHGETYEAAVVQAQDAITSWITSRQRSGRPIPAPRRYHARRIVFKAGPGALIRCLPAPRGRRGW